MSSKFTINRTSKLISAILAMAMVVCLMLSAVMPIAAETNSVAIEDAKNGILQIRMMYKHDNEEVPIKWGTCFVINETTILTAAHVVAVDDATEELLNAVEGGKYKLTSVLYQIVVRRGSYSYATAKKINTADDFAILTLNESINRTALPLGDSDTVETTTPVFGLGFPDAVASTQARNTYTKEDVTLTDGLVQKTAEIGGTPFIQHGATVTEGNSGGPLLDENGAVIGINTLRSAEKEDYYYAVTINQVKATLDDYSNEYSSVGAPAVEPEDEDDDTDAEVTEAPATEAPIVEPTEAPDNGGSPAKLIIIIAIIVLVLILVAVVIVIIVSSSKKPKGPKNPGGPTGVIPPSAPAAPKAPSAPSAPPYAPQPYNRPPMPPQGAAPTMPSNDGAGETSVLNEGAGETTVLGGGAQATGFTLVKVKNGERININKPEFTIGKERRRVDYCIDGNNSISRTHAKLKVRGGRCYITDLGSTNCTYVNGVKLSPNQEVILSSGDKIKLSDEEFEFVG